MAVLLVGNGINQYESLAPDWANLVKGVSSALKITVDYCSTEREQSMTLGFERFILNAMRCDASLKESQIKIKDLFPAGARQATGGLVRKPPPPSMAAGAGLRRYIDHKL